MSARFVVERPDLTTIDLVKIALYAKYQGVQAIIDQTKGRYLIVKENTVGFVQKHKGKLFVAFKDETIDDVDKIANIAYTFERYNIKPENQLMALFTKELCHEQVQ